MPLLALLKPIAFQQTHNTVQRLVTIGNSGPIYNWDNHSTLPPNMSSNVTSSSRSHRVFSSEKLFFKGDRRRGLEQISDSSSKRKEPYNNDPEASLHVHKALRYSLNDSFSPQILLYIPTTHEHSIKITLVHSSSSGWGSIRRGSLSNPSLTLSIGPLGISRIFVF